MSASTRPTCTPDEFGGAIDTLDNLISAMQMPLPAQMHLDQLRAALPRLSETLKQAFVFATGDDPWGQT